MTRTDDLRAAMTSGQPYTPGSLSESFGLSASYPGILKSELEILGYVFTSDGGIWSCTNPWHKPTEAQQQDLREVKHQRAVKQYARKQDRKAQQRQQPKLRPRPSPPRALEQATEAAVEPAPPPPTNHNFDLMTGNGILGIPGFERTEPTPGSQPPPFAGDVQVFAMALQDNGVLRLGLQTADRKWVVDVIAELAR